MKEKNIWKAFAAMILGLLGFSSCDWIGIGALEYGEPHADFKVLGNVNSEDGKPIEGIRVAVRQHRHYENTSSVFYDQNDWYEDDTVYTDSKGKYELFKSVFSEPNEVTVVFEDVDGPDNGGEFRKEEAQPEIRRTKKGDKKWYGGAFEAKADVTMKKK